MAGSREISRATSLNDTSSSKMMPIKRNAIGEKAGSRAIKRSVLGAATGSEDGVMSRCCLIAAITAFSSFPGVVLFTLRVPHRGKR